MHVKRDALAKIDGAAAKVLDNAEVDALAHLSFPKEQRVKIRTNKVQERVNCELKCRAKVVQAFPSTGSVTRLLGGIVDEINADGESGRLFMSKESLKPVLGIRVGLRTPLNSTQSARITPGARSWLPNQVFEPKSLKNAAEGHVAERYCAIR